MTGQNPNTRRRDVLKAAAGSTVIPAVALAGCNDDDSNGGDYPNQEITYIVPTEPGGGLDEVGRIFSEMWPNYLPNEPNIVVENIGGAALRRGTNAVYRADPDGYTVGGLSLTGMAAQQAIIDVDFDITEFSHVNRYHALTNSMFSRPDSDYNDITDLEGEEDLSIAWTGGGSQLFVVSHARDEFGFTVEPVPYETTPDAVTAVMGGEVDIGVNVTVGLRSYFEDGDINPLVIWENEQPDWAPDATTASDLNMPEIPELSAGNLGVSAPPEVPDERLSILRDSFIEMLESEEAISRFEEMGRDLEPVNPDEINDIINDQYEFIEEHREILEPFL